MTALHEMKAVPGASTAAVDLLTPRLIGVGVRDEIHDAATLAWATAEAVAGVDAVHVVHSYLPLRLEGCGWEPVARARDARYLAGSRVVAQAVRRTATDHAGLRVAGSAIAGLPDDMLQEFSSVVDVLVIGDDSEAPAGRPRVSWKVQDVADCPVVSVPHGYRSKHDHGPVTVVAGERGLSAAAMHFAADAATRRDVTLMVSRTWQSLHEGDHPGPEWLAAQQEELDTQLADWRARYPHLAIVARIELDSDWLDRLRSGSSLLVAGRGSADAVRSNGPPRSRACPTVVVPERRLGCC
jgi:hypothetical protein